ncbi:MULTISPECIES: asparaginase [unclassified Ruminococcus]|uniref:asparaginase n=1 Tax=unclassified Ruminococcus TaxID=2608920 RepID=UPI00210D5F53|nr:MULTISPECIES: asparaginase domain-containing protein [unclassified Ruminococcus]MCQ4022599.1 hypothetical protein [Ruminococcus sp. zg-924]MCQ4114839.1 hypothetical protein [Ruminococcus sp. zg-921]
MKKILLITTGGTISCGSGNQALSPALYGAELLHFITVDSGVNIDYSDLLFIDSTSIKPEHWELIADEITGKADIYDGFVITHGTDTLAYTAAMLSFLLCKLNKPVIITGSQKTMFEENSDAPDNLTNAIKAACCGICGVYIVFGSRIIYGTRGYKEETGIGDGFVSVNKDYAGRIKNGTTRFFCENTGCLYTGELPCSKEKKLDAKVISINITPGDNGEVLKLCSDCGYDGIVLCGYGTGGLPNKAWEDAVEYAVQKGVLLVMVSQCRHGVIIPSRYAVGNSLERLGIISACDMTLESAYCKLLWLLSVCENRIKAARLFAKNICEEINLA